jgi:hypothetical protein
MRRKTIFLSVTLPICGVLLSFAVTSAAAVTAQSQAAAQAEGFANSAVYNAGMGMGPQQQNQPISGSDRDANGKLLLGNGVLSGSGSAGQQSGVSQSGIGGANTTAIGNTLNLSVTESRNSSQQSNAGNQNANASLNGNLKF